MIIPEVDQKINTWAAHKRLSLRVSKHLRAAAQGLPKLQRRYDRMAQCGNRVIYEVDQEGIYHYKGAWLCRDRLCPLCSWRLSIKRVGEMMNVLRLLSEREPDTKAIHVVLTVRNCPLEELRSVIKQMSTAFTRLRKAEVWKDYVLGYARSIEVTYNAAEETYHPHIHVVCIVHSRYTRQISIGEWVSLWRRSMRIKYNPVVWARGAYTEYAVVDRADPENMSNNEISAQKAAKSAIIEALKYTMKPDCLTEAAAAGDIGELAAAISGVRMVSFGGILKDLRRELLYSDRDEPEEQLPAVDIDPGAAIGRYLVVYEWCASTRSYVRVAE